MAQIRVYKSAPNTVALGGSGGLMSQTLVNAPQTRFPELSEEFLKPSRLATALRLTAVLFRPVVTLALLIGASYAFATSAQRAEDEISAVENLAIRLESAAEAVATRASLSYWVGDSSLRGKEYQVNFISGLIAANRPEIKHCGEVARIIVQESAKANIDPFFVAAVISVESRFGTNSRSPVGATGLMQLMPRTALELAQKHHDGEHPQLTDPTTNIQLGVEYLKYLQKMFNGNITLVLSAYNWGPTNVNKVKQNISRIPKSVRKYSRTIITRSKRWRAHYERAVESALELT